MTTYEYRCTANRTEETTAFDALADALETALITLEISGEDYAAVISNARIVAVAPDGTEHELAAQEALSALMWDMLAVDILRRSEFIQSAALKLEKGGE